MSRGFGGGTNPALSRSRDATLCDRVDERRTQHPRDFSTLDSTLNLKGGAG
jgi:hypothetical protein